MQLSEIGYEGQPPIDAYGPGFFRVNKQVHEGPLLILPDGVKSWGGHGDWDAIVQAAKGFDVIFVGMGADILPLAMADRHVLEQADVAFETMGTPAACRTYNVLLSEARRVAVAVLPV